MRRIAASWPWCPLLGAVVLAGGALPGLAGSLATWPALAVFPGMAPALLLGWRRSAAVRGVLGLTLAPLVAATLGWLLVSAAGMSLARASWTIAIGSWLLWLALEIVRAVRPPADVAEDPPEPRLIVAWSLALAAVVALPLLLNPFLLVHGDGWIHAGLVWEIALRGFPPQDPRFAGLPLNYVWFYNLFIAQLTSLRGQDPFVFMAIQNVMLVALCVRLTWRLGQAVWRDREAASGAALLLTLAFNAGAWLLWPLHLLTALTGQVRGLDEMRRIVHSTHLLDDRVFFALGAPFGFPVAFLEKFLLGTALTYAWALTLFYLWALIEWVRTPRLPLLVCATLGAAGLMLFHFVPGLSVLPVTLATLALAIVLRRWWPWLPPARRLLAFGAATGLGILLTLPYTISVLSGWRPSRTGLHESNLHFGYVMAWTLAVACAAAAAFAWKPLRRAWSERRSEATLLALYLAVFTGFSLVVHLAEDNESKFAFLVFMPLAVFGGAAFLPALRDLIRRRGVVVTVLLLALLAAHHVMLLVGYAADSRARGAPELNRDPATLRFERWVRDSTDSHAVFVDNQFSDLLMVRAGRRLYYGSHFGPERAGFPLDQITTRRAVMSDLYGAGADLDGDARELRGLGAPVEVLYRAEDWPAAGSAGPWSRLESRPDLFRSVRDRDGFRVFGLRR